MISNLLRECGMELIDEGIRSLWNPDDEGRAQCFEFGKRIACAAD